MAERSQSRIFAPGLLEGQVCVVSGAGTGLGKAAAFELTGLGATVIGCGRRSEPLEAMVGEVSRRGGKAEFEALDIRDEEAVDGLMAGIVERHGRIDVLVNNAGGQFLSPAEAITPKGFRTVIELNVQGTWQMTHAAATKAFIPQGTGKVISITVSPHMGFPGMVHTGAARAAVENMTRTLSVEWARHGTRLVAVAIGQFDTETLRTKYPKAIVDNVARTVPLGRLGTEGEMAWLVAYLASPAGDFFSGCVLTLDGARDNWFGSWPPGGAAGEGGEPLAEERKQDS
jgi:citronellol/citronellal dehydrogenase